MQFPQTHFVSPLPNSPDQFLKRLGRIELPPLVGVRLRPQCGKKAGVPVYKSLKEAITRRFGEEFYTQLDAAAELLKQQ